MAEIILKDAKIYIDGNDFSADLNRLALEYGSESEDRFTMGSNTNIDVGTLKKFNFSAMVLWQVGAGSTDAVLFPKVGLKVTIATFAARGDDGDADAYFAKVLQGQYDPLSSAPGARLAWAALGGSLSDEDLVRATVLHDRETARTATFNGVARQVGAVPAGQRLFAVMQVLAASGGAPTLDVDIESDNASGFPSAVVQASFTQATAQGAQVITPVTGPITDDWWRIAATIGGAGPSFTFFVGIGIQV